MRTDQISSSQISLTRFDIGSDNEHVILGQDEGPSLYSVIVKRQRDSNNGLSLQFKMLITAIIHCEITVVSIWLNININ